MVESQPFSQIPKRSFTNSQVLRGAAAGIKLTWPFVYQRESRGQDKSEKAPQLALDSVSWGVWHCFAQHFENAAQRSAKVPGRPILEPVGGHFPIYLGLGVYCHGVCLHSLQRWRARGNKEVPNSAGDEF